MTLHVPAGCSINIYTKDCTFLFRISAPQSAAMLSRSLAIKIRKGFETENKSGYFKSNPVFDWQPVKCLEQWSNMLMSALAKNNLRCMVLNFLQPVHLITVGVNEQRVATV